MSAAHTCFRSVLSQAFRSPGRGVAASCSVPAFLVPALASRPSRHSSTSGKRRTRSQQQSTPHTHTTYSIDSETVLSPSKLQRSTHLSRISFPAPNARDDIEAWLAVIEPFLPVELRQGDTHAPDLSQTVTALDLACVLDTAGKSSLDIISYLGLSLGRWRVVTWICKKLAGEGRQSSEPPAWVDPTTNIFFSKDELPTLHELSQNPIHIERVASPRRMARTLEDILSAPESIDHVHAIVKRALGQLWRSLGNLILIASEQLHANADEIMPHVLEIIADLHHRGFMPDSVYAYQSSNHKHTSRQPPTLHMLSTKILTALSDASWRAHEAALKATKDGAKASHFLGYEIPGSRYRVQVSELAPELWLELVLWSTLHGGWVLDGMEIIRKLARRRGQRRWSLISWREILEAEEKRGMDLSRWQFFMAKNTSASPQDRAITKQTISGEVVTAFADGLVNQIRVGVGSRGLNPEELIEHLKVLKKLLDKNNLSLGSTAWDTVMTRLLESGGINPEKRPDTLFRICELAPGFGAEINTANASPATNADIPYFFEPTTVTLSLLHRSMRAFTAIGDIKGAIQTLGLLQQHTDSNKEKSIREFFEHMKTVPLQSKKEPFTSRVPPVDFPAFETKLPIPLLARLLDLATESQWYDFGRWLLFSDDIDGPLISPELHNDRKMAASIIHFGTMAGEHEMVVQQIRRMQISTADSQQQRMPAELLTALFCSQLKLHRWESAQGMQEYICADTSFRPPAVILSTFAAELLRTSNTVEGAASQAAFCELLESWETLLLRNIRNELYCVLGIMSSVDVKWKEFCSPFLSVSLRQPIKLSTGDFNRILGGVLYSYGSKRGKEVVEEWCHTRPGVFDNARALGGVRTMPRNRISASKEYKSKPADLVFVQESGAKLSLHGRILPNGQTIWAILRKLQSEVSLTKVSGFDLSADMRAEVRETLDWATRMLYYLGYDHEDTLSSLSSLAEYAKSEATASSDRRVQTVQNS